MSAPVFNLTPHEVQFQREDGTIVTYERSFVFGSDVIRLKEGPPVVTGSFDGIPIVAPSTYEPDTTHVEAARLLPTGSVLIMSMLAAQHIMKYGVYETFGRNDLIIASPSSGTETCTRGENGQIKYSHSIVFY